jgi:hypothetical protein
MTLVASPSQKHRSTDILTEDRMELHGLYPPPSDEFFRRCPGCKAGRAVYEQDAKQSVVHMQYACGTERWFANGMRWRSRQSEQCRLNNPSLLLEGDGWTSCGRIEDFWTLSHWLWDRTSFS